MAIIKDKYLVEVDPAGNGAFKGLGSRIDSVAVSVDKLGAKATAAIDKLTPNRASQKTLDELRASYRELAGYADTLSKDKSSLNLGKSTASISEFDTRLDQYKKKAKAAAQEIAESYKSISSATAAYVDRFSSASSKANASNSVQGLDLDKIQKVLASKIYSQDFAGSAINGPGGLTNYFNSLRSGAAANVGGLANLTVRDEALRRSALATQAAEDLSARAVKKTTDALKAREQATKALELVNAAGRLSVGELTAAEKKLTEQFTGTNKTVRERTQLARDLVNSLIAAGLAEEDYHRKSAPGRSTRQNRLLSSLSQTISSDVASASITGAEGRSAEAQLRASILKDEIRDTTSLRGRINEVVAALRAKAAAQRDGSRVATIGLIEERNAQHEITIFLHEEAKNLGLNQRLRGSLRSVIEQTTAALVREGVTLKGNERIITDLLKNTAAVAELQREIGPSQLNDFGMAFAAGFASQQIFSALANVTTRLSEFEDGLLRVRRTTGASAETTKAFGAAVLELGTEVPLSLKELTAAAASLGQVGALEFKGIVGASKYSAEIQEAADAVKLIAQTSLVSEIDAETAANSYGQFKEVFSKDIEQYKKSLRGLGIEGATTADAMKVLFGSINETANSTVATTQDILDFTRQFGGMAASLGVAAQDVVAMAGAIRNLQVSADVGGTALLRFFSRASADSAQFGKILGVNADVFRSQFSAAPMETVLKVLQTLKDQTKDNALAAQDFANSLHLETRERGTILKLIENMDTVQAAFRGSSDLLTNFNSVQKEAEVRENSLSAAVNRLSNAFTKLLSAGQPLYDMLTKVVGKFADLLTYFSNGGGSGGVIILSGLTAVLAGVLTLVVKVVAQWRLAVASLKEINESMREQLRLQQRLANQPQSLGAPGGSGKSLLKGIGATLGIALLSADIFSAATDSGEKAGSFWGEALRSSLIGVALFIPDIFKGLARLPVWHNLGMAMGSQVVAGLTTALAGVAGIGAAAMALFAGVYYLGTRKIERDTERMEKTAEAWSEALQRAAARGVQAAKPVSDIADSAEKAAQSSKALADTWVSAVSTIPDGTAELEEFSGTLTEIIEKIKKMGAETEKAITLFSQLNLRSRSDIDSLAKTLLDNRNRMSEALQKAGSAVGVNTMDILGFGDNAADEVLAKLKSQRDGAKRFVAEMYSEYAKYARAVDVQERGVGFDPNSGVLKANIGLRDARLSAGEAGRARVAELDKYIQDIEAISETVTESQAQYSRAADAVTTGALKNLQNYQKLEAESVTSAKKLIASLASQDTEVAANDAMSQLARTQLERLNANLSKLSQEANKAQGKALTLIQAEQRRQIEQFSSPSKFTSEYQAAVTKQVEDLMKGAENTLNSQFDSAKDRLKLQQYPERLALEASKQVLSDMERRMETVSKQKEDFQAIVAGFKSLEKLRLDGLSTSAAEVVSTTQTSQDAFDSLADTTQKMYESMGRLGTRTKGQFAEIRAAVEAAAKSVSNFIRQSAFSAGVRVGVTGASEAKRDTDANRYIANNADAKALYQQAQSAINQMKPGQEAAAGRVVGDLMEKFRLKAEKQGRTGDSGFAAFLEKFQADVGALFKGNEPKKDVATAIQEVGATTNDLLKQIKDGLSKKDGEIPNFSKARNAPGASLLDLSKDSILALADELRRDQASVSTARQAVSTEEGRLDRAAKVLAESQESLRVSLQKAILSTGIAEKKARGEVITDADFSRVRQAINTAVAGKLGVPAAASTDSKVPGLPDQIQAQVSQLLASSAADREVSRSVAESIKALLASSAASLDRAAWRQQQVNNVGESGGTSNVLGEILDNRARAESGFITSVEGLVSALSTSSAASTQRYNALAKQVSDLASQVNASTNSTSPK